MKAVAELLHYAEQYVENKPFHEKYKKSKDPDRYLRMHETQLILYDGAERMLLQRGVAPKSVNVTEIQRDYTATQARKDELLRTLNAVENEVKKMQQNVSNIEQYVGKELSIQTCRDLHEFVDTL